MSAVSCFGYLLHSVCFSQQKSLHLCSTQLPWSI